VECPGVAASPSVGDLLRTKGEEEELVLCGADIPRHTLWRVAARLTGHGAMPAVRISVRICFIMSDRLSDATSILPCELEAASV
jgi:hypothetical protein